MAYSLLTSKAAVASTTGTTWAFTGFGMTIPAGTLIDIGWGGNLDARPGASNAKLLSARDNSAQSGKANVFIPILPNPGGTTVGLGRIRCYTTRDILATDTITVTIVGGTMSRRSGLMLAFAGASATTQLDKTAIQSARTASPVTMGATAALAEAASLAVAMSAWRGGAVASGFANTSGTYTALAGTSSGGTTPNVETNAAYKLSAGTAAETDVHTFTSISAACGEIATYRPNGYVEDIVWPTFTVRDSFNAGASQSVAARSGWGAGHFQSGDFNFQTDATPTAAGVALGTPTSNIWGTLMGRDQEVSVTLLNPDTFYLLVRGNTPSGNQTAGYILDVFWNGGLEIRTYSGTVLATFAVDTFPRPVAGDSYCFSAIGSTLTAWRRASGGVWQVMATVQDATYATTGYVGMVAESGSGVTITDFGADDYVSTVSDSGTATIGISASAAAERIVDSGTALVEVTRETPRLVIPAYNYPSPTTAWDAWIAGADPVKFMIANPASGPGSGLDTNYAAVIAAARAKGITILGYVDTDYTRPDASTAILDPFNAGAAQLLTARAGWHTAAGNAGWFSLRTDAGPTYAYNNAQFCANFWATLFAADQEAQATIGTVIGGDFNLYVRSTSRTTLDNAYYVYIEDGGFLGLGKNVAGANLNLTSYDAISPAGTWQGSTFVAGDLVSLRAEGNVLSVYVRQAGVWTLAIRGTDSSFAAAGYIGLSMPNTSTFRIDGFGGGNLRSLTKTNIDLWKSLYGVNDIFFDQASSGAADVPWYADLCDYVHKTATAKPAVVMLNPGTNVDEGYARIADIICSFEGPESGYGAYSPSGWMANWPASKFLHLLYNAANAASMQADIAQAVSQNAGYVYISDTNVWYDIPAFWTDETAYLRRLPAGSVVSNTISDSGTATLTITPSGAETIRDAATQAVGIVQTASEQIQEPAATAIVAVTQTASERITDAGVQTIVVAPTGADALVQAATAAFSLTQSASEQIQDAGTSPLVITPGHTTIETDQGTAVIGITTTGADVIADSGTCSFGIAASGSEALVDGGTGIVGVDGSYTGGINGADSGTGLVVVTPTGVEMLSDSGTCTIGIAASGSQAIADAGSSSVVIAPTATEVVVWNDAGTASIGIAAAASETLRDAGAQSVVIAASGVEASTDRGTAALVIAPSAAEALQDSGAQAIVIAPTAAVETVVTADAGTCAVGIAASAAAEGVRDTGTQAVGIAASGAETIRDTGTQPVVIAATASEVPVDGGTAEFVVDGSGAEVISEPVGLCTFSVTQTAAQSVATIDSGTVTFSVTQTYKTGEAGTVTFSIVGGSVATERIMDSGTFVFAISEKASSSSGIDLGSGSPYSLDRARRARLRAITARIRSAQAQNPWRRDRNP